MLGAWGIDLRDPTADRRLVEYCLSIPTEYYLCDGVDRGLARRAFADRLPQAVLTERRKGYPAADWHEFAGAGRDELAAELDRIAACEPARDLLDVERLRGLLKDWPKDGWERPEIRARYRQALLRGIAAGHFLRKAFGANR
jgi:asparagine synthase (glutamine-hydrolysing)